MTRPGIAINVGNSRVALGAFTSRGLERFYLPSRFRRTAGQWESELTALLDPLRAELAGGWAALASVVPLLTDTLVDFARRLTGGEVLVVRGDRITTLRMAVPDPGAVGADRIANAAGAAARGGLPAIVVDLGTATHLEVVTEGPTFAGGVIAPGIATAAEALFAGTALLRPVAFDLPARAIGRTTEECLQSGLFYGAVAQVDGLVRAVSTELERRPHVLLTGGLAERYGPYCETVDAIVPELTLLGLRALAESEPAAPGGP